MAQQGGTNAANAAEKLSDVENTFKLMGQGITLANTVSGYVSPLWAFLEKDHVIKFGCGCVSWGHPGYTRRRRWSGVTWESGQTCSCVLDESINIMTLFQSFSTMLEEALGFLEEMFQLLIEPVNTEIDNLQTVALDWLEDKFDDAFNLDDLLVIPNLIEGFQTTKTDIMSRVNAALPIDTMLNEFQVAKTQMLAMSDQDESDCKQRPQYIEIQSGTCASHAGYGLITSSEECAAALAAIFSARPLLHASQIQCSRVCQLKESSITSFQKFAPVCQTGYSNNWGSEYGAARGSETGKVIWDVETGLTTDSCRSKCRQEGATTFNFHTAGGGCRCYSKVQASSITLEGTGWNFCEIPNIRPTYVIDKENAGCNNHAAIQIGSIYDQDNADTNTLSKCAAKCFQTSGCVHFSFGKNARVNDCILLNGPCTYGDSPNWNQYTSVGIDPTANENVLLSGGNDGKATNLQACIGECDNDGQCAPGLECYQRSHGEAIPGCTGSGQEKNWDYCYDPVNKIELSGVNDDNAKNLQACIGECDNDGQCAAGLECFQRSNGETIPGCKGSGAHKGWDYCYVPQNNELAALTSGENCD